jgi:DNA polymerase-3 subunit gamma/tau
VGQALYRKYRPRSFEDAVGQDAVTKTLAGAIKSGRISHAYLFAGPRGVGKTSIARILAHQINQLPYQGDDFHLDIIEIDAASNRRIDEIRDLREKVHIAPTSAKYKVYIIDEVHMLTKEAFNALLKTLEEPPAHCVFILATTEGHKLPETIVSRTQRFDFKPISRQAASEQLRKIAKAEKIKIDDKALKLLAEFGEGSLRDITGLLDQLSAAGKPIDEPAVRDFLGLPAAEVIDRLIKALYFADAKKAITALDELQAKAADPAAVAKALSRQLRQKILDNELSGEWATTLLKELVEVPASSDPEGLLELAVIKAAARENSRPGNSPPPAAKAEAPAKKPIPLSVNKEENTVTEAADFNLDSWPDILAKAKAEAPSLHSALRLAKPRFDGNRLELVFPFQLHQKKVQEAKQTELTAKIIAEVTGAKPAIRCSLDKSLADNGPQLPKLDEPETSELNNISNIFGTAEVLES